MATLSEAPDSGANLKAMELFELAMEKELHGLMSDAVKYYREAFKLNSRIDLLYRQQKVPQAVQKLKQEHGKNFSKKIDQLLLRSINVDELLALFELEEAHAPDPNNPDHYDESHMAIKFASMDIGGEDRVVDLGLVLPLIKLPNEIWVHVLDIVVSSDPELWFSFGVTCKKHAYLAFASSELWSRMCYLVFPKQVYEENVISRGHDNRISHGIGELPVPSDPLALLPAYNNSWKTLLHDRPFVKFLGCYISVVNYYSEGARPEFSLSWTNPVRTITYYRFLRFYPQGRCVMALTTLEPTKVVPQLLRENTLGCLLANPELDVNHATAQPHRIFQGTWTISTEGEVEVRVDSGSVPYYTFFYRFKVGHVGGTTRHNKLAWMRYYAIRKKMFPEDDREGEHVDFSLRNEKSFKFLRVRSYAVDN